MAGSNGTSRKSVTVSKTSDGFADDVLVANQEVAVGVVGETLVQAQVRVPPQAGVAHIDSVQPSQSCHGHHHVARVPDQVDGPDALREEAGLSEHFALGQVIR